MQRKQDLLVNEEINFLKFKRFTNIEIKINWLMAVVIIFEAAKKKQLNEF